MTRFVKYPLLLAVLSITCWAQGNRLSLASPPQGGIRPKNSAVNSTSQSSTIQPNSTYNGIDYHGGPVMNDPHGVNVYLIWYGDWSNDTQPAIVTEFVKHLGGTAYFNINTSYYDYNPGGEKDPVVNRVNYGGSITDHYSLGSSLSDNDVAQVVGNAIGPGMFPEEPNGIYLVLTSKDVTEQEFCVNYCAWHAYGIDLNTGVDIKVGYIGDSAQCPSFCSLQNPSPNNNPAADDAVDGVAHEVSEAATDPLFSGWWVSATGFEMADLCEYSFGKTKLLPNGSTYNLKFGGRPYLVQQLWVNARGGYCALALDE